MWLNGVELSNALHNWLIPTRWTCAWLTSLGLRNGYLDVAQAGRPVVERRQSHRRLRWLIRLLRGLPNLLSLDLGGNYLHGQLSAVLQAVQRPLQRLSLAGHEFSAEDIDALSTWSHAAVLREIDIRQCVLFNREEAAAATHMRTCSLVIALRRYVALQRLSLAGSDLCSVSDLCSAIDASCWPALMSFDLSNSRLLEADVEQLADVALRRCVRLGQLCIPAGDLSLETMRNIIDRSGRKDLDVVIRQAANPSLVPSSNSFVISDGIVEKLSTFSIMSARIDSSCVM